jgi:hypothetical protein
VSLVGIPYAKYGIVTANINLEKVSRCGVFSYLNNPFRAESVRSKVTCLVSP